MKTTPINHNLLKMQLIIAALPFLIANCDQSEQENSSVWHDLSDGSRVWRVRIFNPDALVRGYALCTGSLINTTANDKSPYFLTANHCTIDFGDAITSPNLSSFTFYWMYEDPSCPRTSTEPPIYSISGATIMANNS